tara:strand:+ start:573 stop:830 length:258 start_codon:yes stop_codon:yes gene_type:complete
MTPKQEDALLDYLQEAIVPLIEQVLVKKLGQAMTFAKQELIQPQRTWVGLTDEEIQKIVLAAHGNADWTIVFARAIEAKLKEKNT